MYLSSKSFFIALILGLLGISLVSIAIFAGSSRTVVAISATPGGKIDLVPITSTTPIRGAETASTAPTSAEAPNTAPTENPTTPEPSAHQTPKPSFLRVASAEKPVVTQVTKSAPATCSGSFVNEFLCLLNQYRASKGKGKLSGSSALSAVALSHSAWMNSTGTFSHEGKDGSRLGDRCAAAGITCRAENLAYKIDTAQKVLDMWIASPSHNANLLGNYKTIGIGISGDYTTLLFN